jgi:large subunit ribosomal protein L32
LTKGKSQGRSLFGCESGMAVPKKKTSKGKRNQRHATWKAKAATAAQKAMSLGKAVLSGRAQGLCLSDRRRGRQHRKLNPRAPVAPPRAAACSTPENTPAPRCLLPGREFGQVAAVFMLTSRLRATGAATGGVHPVRRPSPRAAATGPDTGEVAGCRDWRAPIDRGRQPTAQRPPAASAWPLPENASDGAATSTAASATTAHRSGARGVDRPAEPGPNGVTRPVLLAAAAAGLGWPASPEQPGGR